MSKTIAIANQKGGVGKTTTTACLGIGLARKGKKVLLIDADPQVSLTKLLGWRNRQLVEKHCLVQLIGSRLLGMEESYENCVYHHKEGIDLIPSTTDLVSIEANLVGVQHERDFVLKKSIADATKKYDYILIDCTPSLGMLTLNALTAADSVLIPVVPEDLALEGVVELIKTVDLVKKNSNPYLRYEGILLSRADLRTNVAKEASNIIRNNFGRHIRVFKSPIPDSIKVTEIGQEKYDGKSIYKHNPSGASVVAFESLVEEVMNNGQNRQHELQYR